MRPVRLLSAVLPILAAALCGCNSQVANERLARRQDNIRRTCNQLAEEEATRPERLGRTLDEIEQQHERDVSQSAENPARVWRWLREDFDCWEERQRVHRENIREQLEGDPGNIERTLPKVLY